MGKDRQARNTHTVGIWQSWKSEGNTNMHTPLKVVLESVDLAGCWKPAAVSSCRSQQISFFLKLIQGDFYHLQPESLFSTLVSWSVHPPQNVSLTWVLMNPISHSRPDLFPESHPDTEAPAASSLSYPVKSSSSWCSRHHHFLYSLPPHKSVQRYPFRINDWHCFHSYPDQMGSQPLFFTLVLPTSNLSAHPPALDLLFANVLFHISNVTLYSF